MSSGGYKKCSFVCSTSLAHVLLFTSTLRRRIALHKYDPADLMTSFHQERDKQANTSTGESKGSLSLVSPSSTQVPCTPIAKKTQNVMNAEDSTADNNLVSSHILDQSPISVLAESPVEKHSLSPFDDDDESDDDIL